MAEIGTTPALSDTKSDAAAAAAATAGDVTAAGGGGGHDGVRGASTSSTTTAVPGQQQKEQDTATTKASARPLNNGSSLSDSKQQQQQQQNGSRGTASNEAQSNSNDSNTTKTATAASEQAKRSPYPVASTSNPTDLSYAASLVPQGDSAKPRSGTGTSGTAAALLRSPVQRPPSIDQQLAAQAAAAASASAAASPRQPSSATFASPQPRDRSTSLAGPNAGSHSSTSNHINPIAAGFLGGGAAGGQRLSGGLINASAIPTSGNGSLAASGGSNGSDSANGAAAAHNRVGSTVGGTASPGMAPRLGPGGASTSSSHTNSNSNSNNNAATNHFRTFQYPSPSNSTYSSRTSSPAMQPHQAQQYSGGRPATEKPGPKPGSPALPSATVDGARANAPREQSRTGGMGASLGPSFIDRERERERQPQSGQGGQAPLGGQAKRRTSSTSAAGSPFSGYGTGIYGATPASASGYQQQQQQQQANSGQPDRAVTTSPSAPRRSPVTQFRPPHQQSVGTGLYPYDFGQRFNQQQPGGRTQGSASPVSKDGLRPFGSADTAFAKTSASPPPPSATQLSNASRPGSPPRTSSPFQYPQQHVPGGSSRVVGLSGDAAQDSSRTGGLAGPSKGAGSLHQHSASTSSLATSAQQQQQQYDTVDRNMSSLQGAPASQNRRVSMGGLPTLPGQQQQQQQQQQHGFKAPGAPGHWRAPSLSTSLPPSASGNPGGAQTAGNSVSRTAGTGALPSSAQSDAVPTAATPSGSAGWRTNGGSYGGPQPYPLQSREKEKDGQVQSQAGKKPDSAGVTRSQQQQHSAGVAQPSDTAQELGSKRKRADYAEPGHAPSMSATNGVYAHAHAQQQQPGHTASGPVPAGRHASQGVPHPQQQHAQAQPMHAPAGPPTLQTQRGTKEPLFSAEDIKGAALRPPLMAVRSDLVVRALHKVASAQHQLLLAQSGGSTGREAPPAVPVPPFLGRIVYDPFIDPAELLDAELLRKGVGGKVEIWLDTEWLQGEVWEAGAPSHPAASAPPSPSSEDEAKGDPIAAYMGAGGSDKGKGRAGGREEEAAAMEVDEGASASFSHRHESLLPGQPAGADPAWSLWDLPPLRNRKIWGTDVYTDDSDILAACIHSGWLRLGSTAPLFGAPQAELPHRRKRRRRAMRHRSLRITIVVAPKLVKYEGSLRAGVRSRSWGNSHDGVSYAIESVELVENATHRLTLTRVKKTASTFIPLSRERCACSAGCDHSSRVLGSFNRSIALGKALIKAS